MTIIYVESWKYFNFFLCKRHNMKHVLAWSGFQGVEASVHFVSFSDFSLWTFLHFSEGLSFATFELSYLLNTS